MVLTCETGNKVTKETTNCNLTILLKNNVKIPLVNLYLILFTMYIFCNQMECKYCVINAETRISIFNTIEWIILK